MRKFAIHFFSEEEEGLYLKIRLWRDKFFQPLCVFLAQKKVTPNVLSFLGLLMMAFFVYFFRFNPWFSLLFLLLNLFFDSVDGVLARFLQQQSVRGDLLDHAFDQVSFFIAFLTFLSFQLIQPLWASVYLLNYVIMVFFTMILRSLQIKFFAVIHSKFFLYGTFLFWLLSGLNWFDPMVVFFSVYMIVTNIFLFYKLQWALS